jgi:hypothetical protein
VVQDTETRGGIEVAKKKSITIHSVGAAKVLTKVERDGQEVWRVTSANGRIRELTTSSSSKKTMDEAVTIYGRALQRLANR